MKLLGVDHIGIAVGDLDRCIERFEEAFGVRCEGREMVEGAGVEVAFFRIGPTRIELVTPTSDESPVRKFLAKHGNGIHHICLATEGIGDWLERLAAGGIELVDKAPREGASGKKIAFLHPQSICNILIELSEEA